MLGRATLRVLKSRSVRAKFQAPLRISAFAVGRTGRFWVSYSEMGSMYGRGEAGYEPGGVGVEAPGSFGRK